MSTITRLALQAMVSKTATFDGTGVDTSVVLGAGDSAGAAPSKVATLVIHVESFTGNRAILQVTDSADNFSSDIVAIYCAHIQGALGSTADEVIRIPWYDIPAARFGVTSSKMRVSVTSIDSGTLKYEAWIEY